MGEASHWQENAEAVPRVQYVAGHTVSSTHTDWCVFDDI